MAQIQGGMMNPDCWHYLGSKDRHGYGRIHGTRVHRLAYEMWIGPIGEDFVCHSCDYPPCFNPLHLFKGTPKDNMQDAIKKGRMRYVTSLGEHNGQSKLTAHEVLRMRKEFKPFRFTIPMLARKYNVALGTAIKVIYGGTWKHVPFVRAGKSQ